MPKESERKLRERNIIQHKREGKRQRNIAGIGRTRKKLWQEMGSKYMQAKEMITMLR